VDDFHKKYLSSDDFISVHIRGSDKSIELANIDEINNQYKIIIDEALTTHKCNKIFLMTDDSRLLDLFVSYYGEKIIFTDCLRTNNAVGVHHQNSRNARQLGFEVIVDAYLAKKAKAFIGNGCSNPSLIISCLKSWPGNSVYLLGKNMFNDPYG
ncbi:MAG: hypothetical protein V1782_01525, partial [Pseudomonadota bacterium]